MRTNLSIVLRERGKIVTRRDGHNIWLNTGRTFLTQVMSYSSFSPDVFEQENLPRYIGFGIGGQRQNSLGVANVSPCLEHYPGPNDYLDIDPTYTRLERPARISWASGPSTPTGTYPNLVYDPDDVWLTSLSTATHPTEFSVEWTASFTETDFSDTPFLSVPLSEIGLFLQSDDPNVYNNSPIAYDTFDSISKTANFTMDLSWVVRF